MHAVVEARERGRLARLATTLAAAVLLGLLPGCSSDEPTNRRARPTAAPVARQPQDRPQGTTDRGSRFVDMSAPVGALTAETPPLRARRR